MKYFSALLQTRSALEAALISLHYYPSPDTGLKPKLIGALRAANEADPQPGRCCTGCLTPKGEDGPCLLCDCTGETLVAEVRHAA